MMLPLDEPVFIHPTPIEDRYIYAYADGRRILVERDSASGHVDFIREL